MSKKNENKFYIKTFGCQMNEYDSEIVQRILTERGFEQTKTEEEADIIMLNTCSIRENAHQKVYSTIRNVRAKISGRRPTIGILGCMATNLRQSLLDDPHIRIDFMAGPDNYRRLPELIDSSLAENKRLFEIHLSDHYAYDDIVPLRREGVNAWITVMKGCDNFCTFCVVPFTRGREYSRLPENIIREAAILAAEGFRQVTLLGQNVNSYRHGNVDFADLVSEVSRVDGIDLIRFTSPHPKDFPLKLLKLVEENPKVARHKHLPPQAGSDRILSLMNRTYTKEEFLNLTLEIRKVCPDIALSTDIIIGFPTETDEEFEETVEVMRQVQFDAAFIFNYSEREGTIAKRKFSDDVPAHVKKERIIKLNNIQRSISLAKNSFHIGKIQRVLIEKESTARSDTDYQARNEGNTIVIIPKGPYREGDFIDVEITDATPNVLKGVACVTAKNENSVCSDGYGSGYRQKYAKKPPVHQTSQGKGG